MIKFRELANLLNLNISLDKLSLRSIFLKIFYNIIFRESLILEHFEGQTLANTVSLIFVWLKFGGWSIQAKLNPSEMYSLLTKCPKTMEIVLNYITSHSRNLIRAKNPKSCIQEIISAQKLNHLKESIPPHICATKML